MDLFEEIDLTSFETKDTLNPDIFDLENDKMKIEVRQTLLDIANDFYDSLKITEEFSDILLVGSNANYNWSEFSDVDVHLIVDFAEVSDDKEFIKDYFDSKKNNWNNEHDIKINIYKIEMYVQDTEEENVSGGIYSVLYDTWIKHPEKLDVNIDKNAVQENLDEFLGQLKNAFKYKNDPDRFREELDKLSEYLKDMRNKGLANGDEFSAANIAFKFLRRKGINNKIRSMKIRSYDTSKAISHGSMLGYDKGKVQRQLGGNKAHVEMKDQLTKYTDDRKKKKDNDYSDGIYYSIHGVIFNSLRNASKKTGEKKSTIQYRVHSKNPKYSDYKVIYKQT